jgi:hypothetical protein
MADRGHRRTTASEDGGGALAARYGRAPASRRRDRRMLIALGIVVAIVVVVWFAWVGTGNVASQVEARDTGFTILDAHQVRVDYDVSVPVGESAACALQALNQSHAIVGWKVVEIEASDRFTRSVTQTVRTSQPSVTGLIYRCWLT